MSQSRFLRRRFGLVALAALTVALSAATGCVGDSSNPGGADGGQDASGMDGSNNGDGGCTPCVLGQGTLGACCLN